MKSTTNLQNFTHPQLEFDTNKELFCLNNKDEFVKEEWKTIPNTNGCYEASSFGRVKSLPRQGYKYIKGGILKQRVHKNYFTVGLTIDGRNQKKPVHKLVAMAFLNHVPCGFKKIVDHINNDSLNNFVWNLQITSMRVNTTKDRVGKTSKYLGVCWNKSSEKWVSSLSVKNKTVHLGNFDTEKEASSYYQKALDSIKNGAEIIKKPPRETTSNVRGVNYNNPKGKWVARIVLNKKRKYLGSFPTEQEAIDALNNYKINNNL